MNYQEQPHVFNCKDCRLIGITTLANQASKFGVLIIVGGPQYRSGSHRQFTLLARYLANNGIPTFRFDYRGMGDSEGEIRSFENIHDDIHAAINAFVLSSESLTRIVIWGLCDAASATLLYAQTDSRVVGIILLNPWVHTTKSADQIKLKYYYLPRLLKQSFWSKLFHGNIGIMRERGVTLARHVATGFSAPTPSLPVPAVGPAFLKPCARTVFSTGKTPHSGWRERRLFADGARHTLATFLMTARPRRESAFA